jgi:hypothetical protein
MKCYDFQVFSGVVSCNILKRFYFEFVSFLSGINLATCVEKNEIKLSRRSTHMVLCSKYCCRGILRSDVIITT